MGEEDMGMEVKEEVEAMEEWEGMVEVGMGSVGKEGKEEVDMEEEVM